MTIIPTSNGNFYVKHAGSGFALVQSATGNWSFHYSNDTARYPMMLCPPQRTKWQALAKLSKISPQHLLY